MISVNNLESDELKVYTLNSEVQLLRYNEPNPGLFIAESAKVIIRALNANYTPLSLLINNSQINYEVSEVIDLLKDNVPVYSANDDIFQKITGYNLTRGILCCMKRNMLATPQSIVKNSRRIAVLDDVENPTNVGAIFRSAAAMGIDAVLLTKGSSDPLYRRAIRVSMGTVFQIPWSFLPENTTYNDFLHGFNFKTAAMALDASSISISEQSLKNESKLAIILGNEGFGINEKNLHQCDYKVIIPMHNDVDSLNVAAASAIAFWELR